MSAPIYFIIGPPGSGKGTNAERAAKEFNMVHLSAGDLLRAERDSGSANGELIKGIIAEGKIVPMEITIGLLKNAMEAVPTASAFLIDGFPRNIPQGDLFEKMIRPCKAVVNFECNGDVLETRLLARGRGDDQIETIRKRFSTHMCECEPVVSHYQKQGKLISINTNDTAEAVYERFTTQLKALAAETTA